MRFFVLFSLIFFLFNNVSTLELSYMRELLVKEKAKAEDLLFFFLSLENPLLKKTYVVENGKQTVRFENMTTSQKEQILNNPRLQKINLNQDLKIADFAVIAIEMGHVKGGLLYQLTGLPRYAVSTLKYKKLIEPNIKENKVISGKELIELISNLR